MGDQIIKVLQVASVDITVKKILLPLIDRLITEGYCVHITCSDGPYAQELLRSGYRVTPITIPRRASPMVSLRAFFSLYHLMKSERFQVVHAHTLVAAALARVAARLAGVPVVLCTAHGFYFHDNMHWAKRRALVLMEKLLSRATDLLFTVSREDAMTAVKEGIYAPDRAMWVGNGVNLGHFSTAESRFAARETFRIGPNDLVVGFVGRLVREKGVLDLVEAMGLVVRQFPESRLLLVGDKLPSERDQKAKALTEEAIVRNGLSQNVISTGHLEDVRPALQAMDIFVLPSYREGLPLAVMEAMAAGKPVVATNIRGCREEVFNEVTGLLVPVHDYRALAAAICRLLSQPKLRLQMGCAGQQRAGELFNQEQALSRQVSAYERLIRDKVGFQVA